MRTFATSGALTALAFLLSACGQEPSPPARHVQPDAGKSVPAHTKPQVSRDHHNDGPVYSGETY